MNDQSHFEQFQGLFERGDVTGAVSLTQRLLDEGQDPQVIMDSELVPALQHIGNLFESGRLFLPHLMRAAEAMKRSVDVLTPHFTLKSTAESKIPVVLGTVAGDIHDIGKNIVGLLLSINGFKVIDLGASVTTENFLNAVESQDSPLVLLGMSALLTTTMVLQEQVIRELQSSGLREKTRVIIGGTCVTEEWADSIGADGYGLNGREAVEVARKLSTGFAL